MDAVVCDEAVGENYVRNMGFGKCEEALMDESMSIIAKKDNEYIQKAIDEAINELLTTDTYQQLLKKWELVK